MKKMKKGQTEIMGLAIVVILLILGMTFVIRFMINKEPVDYKKQFTQAELASNMLNTFLKSTSKDCNELSMTELLQDCGQNRGIYCENGKDSCVYAEETAQFVFANTLEKWNLDYELNAFVDEEDPIFVLGEVCPGSKKSKLFPIPTSSRTLFVKLDICG
ncbi:MAG: hypothetical protein QF917_00150 [Candidatus Woesearchaeota archaeon]|jgi:uncharacterized protein (UPF0333 family)|nr:hypothetical protein [Candidatus Woesearchaeota archaeon]|tara:strand:- start:18222 stop:18701 length:480 start_codon:yes stop_codon:yes gene_type:complete